MTQAEAFDVLFLRNEDGLQQVNTAYGLLSTMTVAQFAETAVRVLTSREIRPRHDSFYRGASRSFLGKWLRAARAYTCWMFDWHRFPNETLWITTTGEWLRHLSGGEDYSQWSRTEPTTVSAEDLRALLSRRVDMLRNNIARGDTRWHVGILG